jgi:hypothetical protein
VQGKTGLVGNVLLVVTFAESAQHTSQSSIVMDQDTSLLWSYQTAAKKSKVTQFILQ